MGIMVEDKLFYHWFPKEIAAFISVVHLLDFIEDWKARTSQFCI